MTKFIYYLQSFIRPDLDQRDFIYAQLFNEFFYEGLDLPNTFMLAITRDITESPCE